jgi:hypothetical protein
LGNESLTIHTWKYDDGIINININEPDFHIAGDNDDIKASPILRIYDRIIQRSGETQIQYIKGSGIIDDGRELFYDDDLMVGDCPIRNDDRTEINIPSFDMDINFKVGDYVVIADWANPIEMLKVRRVVSFEVTDNHLYINTIFNNTEMRKESYINMGNGHIKTGHIRKIASTWGGFCAGDKIRANETRIPHFPKKDVNTIIGFIYDTGTHVPLMLCSNCTTLWAAPEVLAKFDIYKKGTLQHKKFANASIDVSKFKVQAGDFYKRRNNDSLICAWSSCHNNRIIYSGLEDWGYSCLNNMNKDFIEMYYVRYGFMTQRYTVNQLHGGSHLQQVRGYPNMHSGVLFNNSCDFKIMEVSDYVQSVD